MLPQSFTTTTADLELRPGVFSRLAASAYDIFQAKAEKVVYAGQLAVESIDETTEKGVPVAIVRLLIIGFAEKGG